MNLHQCILTENECYKVGLKHVVKGIMVHSTGANNPYLKRYVQPDDGLLGVNTYGNDWNNFRPSGRQVCVHAFIGKLKDGTVATYQTLPFDIAGWHSGRGTDGNANFLGYIGFEICEDDLTDSHYFEKVYKEAVELCVYLCKEYGLTEKNIICHSEGYKQGIASNHGDVMHWFPKHGKNMDTFRNDVASGLSAGSSIRVLYRVQLGAFKKKQYANEMLLDVKKAGFSDAYIKHDGVWYRVQIGAFSKKANADAMLKEAKAAGFSDAIIKRGN